MKALGRKEKEEKEDHLFLKLSMMSPTVLDQWKVF